MKAAVVSLVVASGLALAVPTTGCNGGDCNFTSRCANDAPVTQDEMTACNNRRNNPACGGDYGSYLGCFQSHQTCTTAGVTDQNVTNDICKAQYQTWIQCCTGIEGGVADGGFPQCGF
jgi:hypothetical protein